MKMPWQRKDTSDKDVDVLLDQANIASPTGSAAEATPGSSPVTPTGSFQMTVEDVFTIAGRGTVATGKIEVGSITVGQQVHIVRAGTTLTTTYVTGVEMFRKILQTANAGDNVGLLLGGVDKENVMRGDILQS